MKYAIITIILIFFLIPTLFRDTQSKKISVTIPLIDSTLLVNNTQHDFVIDTTVKNRPHSGNKVISSFDKEYAILIPEGYKGNEVHVLFGGSHTSGYAKDSARPGSIKRYIEEMEPYCNNVIIIITHHMNTLENVKSYVKEKFNGKVTSIAGFSQGGRETWRHAGDTTLKLVGLIDPSTYANNLTFGPGTILYCCPNNWGTSGFYGKVRDLLKWYCSNSEKYNGQVICFDKGGTHMNFKILNSFYDKFGDRL